MNNINNTVSLVISIMALLASLSVLAMVMYRNGHQQLQACERDGLTDCHLEWDGLELNAYGKQL